MAIGRGGKLRTDEADRGDDRSDHGRRASQADRCRRGEGVRSIQRALDILSLLTDDTPSVSVRDIVAATGLAKTTVMRLVQTLEHSGLLWATAGGYMAGPGLWRWALPGPAELAAAAGNPGG